MIKISQPSDRFPFRRGESVIYYRHLNLRDQAKINDECMKNGQIDVVRSTLLTLETCVVGWEGVTDYAGNPLEFKPGMGVYLPPGVRDELIPIILENLVETSQKAEKSLKNSKSISGSRSPTD